MTPSPGDVYLVDLGMVAKARLMVAVSRHDADAPRALSLCVPFTTKNRASRYEVAIGASSFFSRGLLGKRPGNYGCRKRKAASSPRQTYGNAVFRSEGGTSLRARSMNANGPHVGLV